MNIDNSSKQVFPPEIVHQTIPTDELKQAQLYGTPFEYEENGYLISGYGYKGKIYVMAVSEDL